MKRLESMKPSIEVHIKKVCFTAFDNEYLYQTLETEKHQTVGVHIHSNRCTYHSNWSGTST